MTTLQQNGFTLTVCEDFVDRVEKNNQVGPHPRAEIHYESDGQLRR